MTALTPDRVPHSEWPLSIDIDLVGERFPLVVSCLDWAAARKWLGSADFKKIADRVERVTITNRSAE